MKKSLEPSVLLQAISALSGINSVDISLIVCFINAIKDTTPWSVAVENRYYVEEYIWTNNKQSWFNIQLEITRSMTHCYCYVISMNDKRIFYYAVGEQQLSTDRRNWKDI